MTAYEKMKRQSQDREKQNKLNRRTFTGMDIVDEVVRLCAMNLYLHGIGNGDSPVQQGDALAADFGKRFDIILTKSPFWQEEQL